MTRLHADPALPVRGGASPADDHRGGRDASGCVESHGARPDGEGAGRDTISTRTGKAAGLLDGSASPVAAAPGDDAAAADGSDGVSANPPLLTGGLLRPLSRSIDWLTVTVNAAVARDLLADTRLDEPGYARPGFKRSERRLTWGGLCWRKWEPLQPSNAFGLEYESWEWSGPAAACAAEFLAGKADCRPSRVDVAFDFECPESFMSDDLVPHYQPWAVSKGISLGIAGQGGVNTHNVGSKQSDRWIRIYRKDLRDPVLMNLLGPVLRIEPVLKGDLAVAWWETWRVSYDTALAGAAWHVHEMMGLRVQDSMHEVPPLVMPESADEAEELWQFLRQHGDRLAAWNRAGVPVADLAEKYDQRPSSRTKAMRDRRRDDRLAKLDVGELVDLLLRLMDGWIHGSEEIPI